MNQVTTEKLQQDLDVVVHDAEELIKATAQMPNEKIAAARERVERSVQRVRGNFNSARRGIQAAGEAVKDANRYVHDNPWIALSVAAGAGMLVGLLMSRHPSGTP